MFLVDKLASLAGRKHALSGNYVKTLTFLYRSPLYHLYFHFCSSLDNCARVNGDSLNFFGSDLVDWLLEVGLVADRITAVYYGNSLLRGRVIRHSQNRYYFRDSKLTYEFCPGWDTWGNQGTAQKWIQLIHSLHNSQRITFVKFQDFTSEFGC